MRLHLAMVVAPLLFIVPIHDAAAQIRITDIKGGEVVIRRGPRPVGRVKAASLRPRPAVITTVTAGADTDAANNDYRRIQNALNAAGSGDTIILSGTFDFTQPFAAAAWTLGNDNTAATGDDYEVLVPPGLNNVILTATALGTGTIQGPGDLAAVNLESFLIFDASLSGASQGWTISNLRILDFDLSIGMFATGVTDYNNTIIQNNFIRMPTDLNATAAPADVNQNIGIHFSFGTNQSILGNSFQIPGDGVSAGANTSSSVGVQSNTSGGAVYNGLNIANNVIHILNAQSANPQATLGFWENAHGHTSTITVFNNSFLNDAAGNDPALNVERAFRVTSHSSASSTVTYDSNIVAGANIGFQWIAASNFTGNQAVVVTGNQITNSATGVLVQSEGVAHFNHNSITGSGAGGGIHVITGILTGFGANTNSVFRTFVSGGSADGIWIEATAGAVAPMSQNDLGNNAGFGLRNQTVPSILAELNWWGNNLAAAVAAEVSGNADFDPWLASGTDVSGLFGFQPFTYATTSGTITTFVGTGAADTGALLAGDPVTMMMNGDTATTALAQLLNFDIQLGGSDDLFTLGQTGIPTVFDAGAGNDTLIGTNVAQTWNITGAGSGNIPGAANSFAAVESLRGGTAGDSFVFGAAGSIAGTLDGNLGVDTLNNSAIPAATITPTGPGTLDGFMGTATGVGATFDNINLVSGSSADLVVSKSGPATVNTSTVIAYTIGVTNNGPNAALNVQLTDPLPAGTTFVSVAAPAGWSCATPAVNSPGTVTCTRVSVPLGPNAFTLTVNGPTTAGSIINTATVTSANEGAPGNESASATTNVQGVADLSIAKNGPASALNNGNINYTITVSNGGPNAATSVVVTDTLPAGVTFVSATPSQGSCSGTTTVTCNLGTLNNGASASIALVVNVTATTGSIVNTATVTASTVDPTPTNNGSTSTAVIAGSIPVAGGWTLLALAALLGFLAVMKMRM